MIVAIDPGPTKSAWVVIDDLLKPIKWGWDLNHLVQDEVDRRAIEHTFGGDRDELVIEDITSYGMPVGRDVFETAKWSGRFDSDRQARFIARKDVKLHVCGVTNAKPGAIKQAVIDRYGGQEQAIGGKKCFGCKGQGDVRREGTRGRKAISAERRPCPDCSNTDEGFGTGYETPPGILYKFSKSGMGAHGWDALALALTAAGTEK